MKWKSVTNTYSVIDSIFIVIFHLDFSITKMDIKATVSSFSPDS